MKKIRELFLPEEILNSRGNFDSEIRNITSDSRQVQPGDLFVAIKGANFDGTDFIPEAISRGAVAVVTSGPINQEIPVCWIQVQNERKTLARIASRFFDYPAEKLYVVGVTGTNGKSTTANLVKEIFSQQEPCAFIGTTGKQFQEYFEKNTLTTPEALEIFSFMDRALKMGAKSLAMEVSSASLKMNRVDEITYRQAIFTGLTPEHLDFHVDMEDYFRSKLILFTRLTSSDWAILNSDDPYHVRIMNEIDCGFLTFGFNQNADIYPVRYQCSLEKTDLTLMTPLGKIELTSPLIGRVNIFNIMAATASAIAHQLKPEAIVAGVARNAKVKGRLDLIYKNDFYVLIDYAHTDRALEELLKSLQEMKKNRLIVVFGAGGNRDRLKRPKMGEVATRLADLAIITSDNPRNEDPQEIIRQIISGIPPQQKNYRIEIDRQKAIETSIALAEKDDIIVIAGKGHEDYQIFHGRTIRFCDDEVALNFIQRKKNG